MKKTKNLVSKKSFSKDSLFYLFYILLIGYYPINVHYFRSKGSDYYFKNLWKIIFISNFPIVLLLIDYTIQYTQVQNPDLIVADRPYHFVLGLLVLIFPIGYILLVFLNLIHDEEGAKIVISPWLIKNEKLLLAYNVVKENVQNERNQKENLKKKLSEEKEAAHNEKVEDWNRKFKSLMHSFEKFKQKYPMGRSKHFLIKEPFFDRPSIKSAKIFISSDNLVILCDETENELNTLQFSRNFSLLPNIDKNLKALENYELPNYAIPLENIISYTVSGSRKYVSNVKGGGSSLGGAIVGGLIAGEVGAVIGSRKSIKTELKEVDNREVRITYIYNKTKKINVLRGSAVKALDGLIPDKYLER